MTTRQYRQGPSHDIDAPVSWTYGADPRQRVNIMTNDMSSPTPTDDPTPTQEITYLEQRIAELSAKLETLNTK